MSAGHWRLANLICLVDVNQMQADGRPDSVLNSEPLVPKWEAFGWHAQRVDGNDIGALVRAFDAARALVERLELDRYHYLHATRAELLRRLDRVDDSRAAYNRALELVHSEAERRFLEQRLAEL